jgi:YHS domain-containing protein
MKLKQMIGMVLMSFALVVGAVTAVAQEKKGKVAPYPLKTCIVTENDLDSMGGEIRRVYDGQEVKFCCRPCIKKFERNPERYLERMRKEAAGESSAASDAAKSETPKS